MQAAIYQGLEAIQVTEVDYRPPGPGMVVIDTKCTGICGSDLHAYFGHWPQSHTEAAGHETCGVVVEVGEGVTQFSPGDRIAMEVTSHCRSCLYCRKGLYNHCRHRTVSWQGGHGGFAEYTTAHESTVFRLPDCMSFAEGALVEPVAVCCRAVAQGKATHQDRVAVIGGGTIGLYCLAVAKAIGVRETLITVKYEQQVEAARAFGADHIVNIGETDVREYVADLTEGFGLDVIIETIGSAQGFNDALALVRRRGTVVLVGGYHKPLEVDLGPIMNSEPIVTGSLCYGYSGMVTDFDAAIDLIASGRIDATRLVTHQFPLSEIEEAFRVSADKTSGAVKVHVVQP